MFVHAVANQSACKWPKSFADVGKSQSRFPVEQSFCVSLAAPSFVSVAGISVDARFAPVLCLFLLPVDDFCMYNTQQVTIALSVINGLCVISSFSLRSAVMAIVLRVSRFVDEACSVIITNVLLPVILVSILLDCISFL